ncbi:MAG TPA: AbrB/MazE/SpoVT family DNA-binding domain-containing protein [Vicinamibacterales bacterium]|nr:AbrB/MazE/SpoVT family DNA-binding domain-containing protein [Vicinamibacterales bacterium]
MATNIETTRLSSKGQVVLPSSIRSARHWKAGTEFQVHETPDGVLLKPLATRTESRIEDVAGCLKAKRRVSLADMEAAVRREAKARHARGRY